MATFRRYKVLFIIVPAILLFYFLALSSLIGDSPTMDEQNHLARGLVFLRTGDPRFSLEHPPLINAASALPLLTVPDIRLPLDHPSWEQPQGWYWFADQLLWIYNDKVNKMIFLARLPIVFLTLGLALVAYRFGVELWGKKAGIITFIFILFDPNILAHGRYITTDVGGTLFILLASLLLWRMWAEIKWHWGKVAAAGLALGLAFGSKYSNLLFIPIFILLSLLPLYPGGRKIEVRRLGQLFTAGLISIPVLWAIYAFQWGPFQFATSPLTKLNEFVGPMPIFWSGIEQILRLSSGGRVNYLLGETSPSGWWYYFPLAYLVKTPIFVILLSAAASIMLLAHRITRKRAIFLFIIVLIFFITIMQSDLNIGYRHLMPVLPYMYLVIGGISALWFEINPTAVKVTKAIIGASMIGSILLALVLYPHYLSYFNIFAGGPNNGHKVLIDSNIDWGQDLLRLSDWIEENDVEDIKLSWFGSADPNYYGIDYQPLPGLPRNYDLWWDPPFDPADPDPGTYAISVSNLWELPLIDKVLFSWFREREPDYKIGYSIYVYVVE